MLDINYLEKKLAEITKRVNTRQTDYTKSLKEIVRLNVKRKKILGEVEKLKADKNNLAKEIGNLMRDKKIAEANELKAQASAMNDTIAKFDLDEKKVSAKIKNKLAYIPNVPHIAIPVGVDEDENVEIRKWNYDKRKQTNIPHWEIAQKLGLVDFETGVKLSGSRFLIYTDRGSKMMRSIVNILLDHHTSRGYKEYHVPFIVNKDVMYGTGQLPKFEDDAYIVGDQYLIPTAEVPLTNMRSNEIIDAKELPIYMTAYSQCFRQESGSAGRDTRGMIRLHQFNKVEMVKIVDPTTSYDELEKMTIDAESVLQLFELPYRVIELCSGDLGFSAAKTYDLEVWFPNQDKFREISSCSNTEDFQARRMQTRIKGETQTTYPHTLNGSGVAVDRLIASILENYYDGEKLILPKVLRPYFANAEYIK